MEQKNTIFNNLLLSETGLFNKSNCFYQLFESNDIKTVAQVFNDSLMEEMVSYMDKSISKEELQGFIKIIKFRYNGELFDTNSIMNKTIKFIGCIRSLGFSKSQEHVCQGIINKLQKEGILNDTTSIYDAFKLLIIDDDFLKFNSMFNATEIVNLCIKAYEMNNELQKEEKLANLYAERDRINKLIAELESKLSSHLDTQTGGR